MIVVTQHWGLILFMNFYDCFLKKSIVLGFCEKAKEKKSTNCPEIYNCACEYENVTYIDSIRNLRWIVICSSQLTNPNPNHSPTLTDGLFLLQKCHRPLEQYLRGKRWPRSSTQTCFFLDSDYFTWRRVAPADTSPQWNTKSFRFWRATQWCCQSGAKNSSPGQCFMA